MKNRRLLGLLILVAVAAATGLWRILGGGTGRGDASGRTGSPVFGFIGSEKGNFLDDAEVAKALLRRGLRVDYAKAGSIEMVTGGFHAKGLEGQGVDFLWPSSQAALEIYLDTASNPRGRADLVFSSPLVLYTWKGIPEALGAAGMVTAENGVDWLTGFPELVAAIEAGKTWAELGLPSLPGRAAITSTDPARSNSGLLFAALVATLLNGESPDEEEMKRLAPRVAALFRRLGYMEHSTGVLFEQYLRIGPGQYPMILGYENQLVEFRLENPELWKSLEGRVRVLYPVPTIWSSHPLIALDAPGESLLRALREPELQAIAWKRHGFRTGLGSSSDDAAALGIRGMPREIAHSLPLPGVGAILLLSGYLGER